MRDYIKFGCKECGSPHVREKDGKLHCVSCGTWFEKNVETDEERDARVLYLTRLDRAEELLSMSPPRFDDAEDHFRKFIKDYPDHSDGYWGLVRARYGIKYEVDTNGKTVPCCYKSSYEDFREDSDFKRALSCAENDKIYGNLKEQAELIAGICEEWRKEAGKYNYDIFISFKGKNEELKISDEDQREMNDLYDFLKDEGYSVFFSPRSMHKHTGMYYDAYIFSALQSAKIMIVYGSKPEYFTSTWVQNEWTRFLRMVDNGEKKMGSCIVVYNGFNPYELPHDLRRIQAVDASQRRFYIDILNSVKRILSEEKKVDTNEELMKQIEALKRQIERDQESNRLKREEKAQIENEKKAAEKEMEALRKKHNDLLEENRKLEVQAKKEYEERKKASEQRKLENDKPRLEIESKAKAKAIEEKDTETNPDFEIVDGCLKKYKGKKTEVVIPEGITSIGNYAFFGCLDIVGVQIPSSITHIGNCAFSCCASLPKMTIPGSVTHIGENAFSGCSKLEIFVADLRQIKNWNTKWNPNNRPVRVKEEAKQPAIDPDFEIVDGCLVKYHGNNANVTIPYGVTEIGEDSFGDCSGIVSINIPNSVTSIGEAAFMSCSSLANITIPSSVTVIDMAAFKDCTSLISITIPGSVAIIGSQAFEGCSSLRRVVILDGVTEIDNYAFRYCKNLESVTIPDSVTIIGESAFEGCSSMNVMTLPNSIVNICDHAFRDCYSLSSIIIGDSVADIGDKVFDSCCNLSNIAVNRNNRHYQSIDGNLYSKDGATLVRYAIGKKDLYFKIPDGVTTIGYESFCGCSSITDVVIPNGVITIGYSAFERCEKLVRVSIPDGVTAIGSSAFEGCKNLININIPRSVLIIGYKAFYNCYKLANVSMSNGIGSIDNQAFYNCSSLTSVDIPNSVISVGAEAFCGCSSLTIWVENPERVREWNAKWNPDNRPVYAKNTVIW